VRFIEMVLLVASLCILLGTKERIVPIGLLAGALGLNLIDRGAIARKLNKQEQALKQLQAPAIPTLGEAEERRSIEGRVEAIETRYQFIADTLEERNGVTIERDDVQPALENFENRVSRLEAAAERLGEMQTLFDALQTVPDSLRLAHEKLTNNEGILEQLSHKSQAKETISQLLEHIKTIRPYTYELVLDADRSRNVLIESLEQVSNHLILVNPWLTESVFDENFLLLLDKTLEDERVKIEIGWGRWADVKGSYQMSTSLSDGDNYLVRS
jgi:hypothetical protein